MDSISDFVRGGRAGCGVQVSGISSSVPFFGATWPLLGEISEILFGHTDCQGLTRSGLSISINRTLLFAFGAKKLRRRAIGENFFMGSNRSW